MSPKPLQIEKHFIWDCCPYNSAFSDASIIGLKKNVNLFIRHVAV